MSTVNDGGQAFPIASTYTNENGITFPHVEPGMTIRDWLAGQALMGQLAFSPRDSFEKYNQPEEVAKVSYRFADAMLAERAKGGAA